MKFLKTVFKAPLNEKTRLFNSDFITLIECDRREKPKPHEEIKIQFLFQKEAIKLDCCPPGTLERFLTKLGVDPDSGILQTDQ